MDDANTADAVDLVLDATPPAIPPADADVVRLDAPPSEKLPKAATLQPNGSVKLALAYPVTLRTQTSSGAVIKTDVYSELTFTRLTGADMRAISNAEKSGDRVGVMFAHSTRMVQALADKLWDKLDGGDTMAINAVLSYFLPSGT